MRIVQGTVGVFGEVAGGRSRVRVRPMMREKFMRRWMYEQGIQELTGRLRCIYSDTFNG